MRNRPETNSFPPISNSTYQNISFYKKNIPFLIIKWIVTWIVTWLLRGLLRDCYVIVTWIVTCKARQSLEPIVHLAQEIWRTWYNIRHPDQKPCKEKHLPQKLGSDLCLASALQRTTIISGTSTHLLVVGSKVFAITELSSTRLCAVNFILEQHARDSPISRCASPLLVLQAAFPCNR